MTKKKILTIDDLFDSTPEEIEEVLNTINLTDLYYAGAAHRGKKTGLTKKTHKKFKPKKVPCKTCDGTGIFIKKPRSINTIHASASSFCRTRLFYDVQAEIEPKEVIKPALQVTFAMGHAIHDCVQSALEDMLMEDIELEATVDFPEAMVYGSHTDGIVHLPQAKVILEIKSISANEFAKLTKPKAEHRTQACGIYATATNSPFISYFYVSKGWPHDVKEFVEPYDPKVFEDWKENKLKPIEEAIETGQPPVMDTSKYECSNCKYSHACPQSRAKVRRKRI